MRMSLAPKRFLLDQNVDLAFTGDFFENSGGENERWLRAANFDWYFIKPNGDIFLWDGEADLSTSTLITQVAPLYYQQPELLYNATPENLPSLLDNTIGLRIPEIFIKVAVAKTKIGFSEMTSTGTSSNPTVAFSNGMARRTSMIAHC